MLKFALPDVLLVTALPAVAQAQSPAPQPQAAPAAKPNPLDKVVCKTEEVIGSRLNSQRVCLTVREWQEQSDANREALERLQQGQGNVPSG